VNDIFLSYSSQDRKRIAHLVAALTEQRGWSIWWDENIGSGSRFTNEIEQELAQSRCVLVAWSRDSVESDWVRSEADQGRKRGILAPVSLDGTSPPMPFEQTETTDFSNWKGNAHAPELLQLMEAVQRILAAGAAPGTEELLQREKRQAAFRRRRKIRAAVIAGCFLVGATVAAIGYQAYRDRQEALNTADFLAHESKLLLEKSQARETEEERKRKWWYLLFNSATWERLDSIDLSLLLGVEAVHIAPTEKSLSALRDALAVSPFSDWSYTREGKWANGRSLDFSHDAKLLAIGGSTGGTLVWDLRNDEVLARIEHGKNPPRGWTDKFGVKSLSRGSRVVDFSPVDYTLATSELDGSIALWDGASGEELWRGQHHEAVVAVRFSPSGSILASASHDGTAKLWDAKTGKELFMLAHPKAVEWIEFSPSGDYVATACRDGDARVWSSRTGEILALLEVGEKLGGTRFSPAGDLLLAFGRGITTSLWNWREQELVWELPVSSARGAGGYFSADGTRLVIGDTHGEISWWDVSTRELLFTKQAGLYVMAMHASADRRRFVTVDSASLVQAWDTETGRELKRLPYASWVKGGAISTDGEFVASGGEEDIREYTHITEVTLLWPDDPILAACSKTKRNFTRNEWRKYFPSKPYRLTCPELGEPENSF
jgi:WD40 repeat protein